ncbi:hypothetical protein ALC56_08195, partial [Trachymyrmex septentrionalis]
INTRLHIPSSCLFPYVEVLSTSLLHFLKPYCSVCQKPLLVPFINTWVLFFTDCVKTERGPVLNSSSSLFANSSGVISDFGLVRDDLIHKKCQYIT